MKAAVNEMRVIEGKKGTTKNKKSIMDCAIGIDILINSAAIAFFIMKIREALQIGIDVALQNDFGIATGIAELDALLVYAVPILIFLLPVSLITDLMYVMIKLRKKQPFLTEKFAVSYMVGKMSFLFFVIVTALIF